jgi:membrane protease YdiL (CAAX protease family)
MFSSRQIIFGVVFFIAFVILMFFLYKKDLKMHQVHYKNIYPVVIAFVLFLALFFSLKFFLQNK